jgi:hypothetical protein
VDGWLSGETERKRHLLINLLQNTHHPPDRIALIHTQYFFRTSLVFPKPVPGFNAAVWKLPGDKSKVLASTPAREKVTKRRQNEDKKISKGKKRVGWLRE